MTTDDPRPRHAGTYRVHGMQQSYFTRKVAAYLDHKAVRWRLRPSAVAHPRFAAAGWPGGIPVVEMPDGTLVWDSTAIILHLEHLVPEPAVLPRDPVQRFLCCLLEDVADEWLYRPAVGSRWFHDENNAVGGFELARDVAAEVPVSADDAFAITGAHVRSSCGPLGVTAENIGAWVEEVLRPWLRVLGAHLETRPYLFGGRPSLADFAVFGGNAAHFTNDPLCRRWTDADAPAVVAHTYRLMLPDEQPPGAWSDPDDVPPTLLALLADAGRLYLPWVARATVEGEAPITFITAPPHVVRATPFLVDARTTLLARYVACRCPALDAVLDRAGILPFFADHVARAGRLPDVAVPPQPRLNRPYPPAEA